MLTITGLAKELNTTPMTVYRRIKKNGINIEDLRDSDTGELTTQGASIIASLFRNNGTTPDEQAMKQIITDVATGDVTDNEVITVGVLQARLEGATALVEQLTSERDELRRQLATVTAALQAEQADRAQERQLLTAGSSTTGDKQQRRWWQFWNSGSE